jgi:hypothetical protein
LNEIELTSKRSDHGFHKLTSITPAQSNWDSDINSSALEQAEVANGAGRR